jgi:hypothetical protein
MHKSTYLLVAGIAVAGFLGLSAAPALASSGPSSAQTTVTGNVSEVVGWETPPPASFSLGSLIPGQLSTPQDIPWAVDSNDGNGTDVILSIQNNGAQVSGTTSMGQSVSGNGPFTGTNAASDNATYLTGTPYAATGQVPVGLNYGWDIDGTPGAVPQGDQITEYTIAANDTSTYNTSVAFQTPNSVFPDTVSATFTYTLVGQ